MRKWISGLAAAAFLLGMATTVQAGVLQSASFQNVTSFGTGSFALPNATGTATGSTATVDVGAINDSIFLPLTGNPPVTKLGVFLKQGGVIGVSGNVINPAGTISGSARPGFDKKGGTFTDILNLPINAGAVGLNYALGTLIGQYLYVSVTGFGWAIDPVVVTGVTVGMTVNGTPIIGNATFSGSNNLTSNGGGTVTLVSPSRTIISSTLLNSATAGVSNLTLTYLPTPEPSATLMAVAGVAALGMAGWRRSRRS